MICQRDALWVVCDDHEPIPVSSAQKPQKYIVLLYNHLTMRSLTDRQHTISTKLFDLIEEDDIMANEEYLFLKLGEEIGDFHKAFLVYKNLCKPQDRQAPAQAKTKLSKKFADIFGLLLTIAETLEIDIEDSLEERYQKIER